MSELSKSLREKLAFDAEKLDKDAMTFYSACIMANNFSEQLIVYKAMRHSSLVLVPLHDKLISCVLALENSIQILRDEIDRMTPSLIAGKISTKGIHQLKLEKVVEQQTKALAALEKELGES